MYDYIKIVASEQKITITFACTQPQKGARNVEYLCKKEYNLFCKISSMVTGDIETTPISEQDFYFAFGTAVGELSKNASGKE